MNTALIGLIAAALVALVFLLLTRRRPTLPADDSTTERGELPQEKLSSSPNSGVTGESTAERHAMGDVGAPVETATPAGAPGETAAKDPAGAATLETTTAEPSADPVKTFRRGLAGTRSGFVARLAKLFAAKPEINAELIEQIEEVLITADIGVKTSDRILEHLRKQMSAGLLEDEDAVWRSLRDQAEEILSVDSSPLKLTEHKPSLLLVAGVNGVGKTTTIGKLASRFASDGRRVLLAAGDTFRAAAELQLEVWGERVGCPVVTGKEGADPGSVIFDAIKRAENDGYDLVIADTAGRLHTKQPLMEELKKLQRTATKALGGRPVDEILLVLDSTTGQNAVQQMYMFREALDIGGVVLTKLDGTAKGGVILGIVDEHRLPVRFIGLGEKIEDLREFDAHSFVRALFEKPDGETMAA